MAYIDKVNLDGTVYDIRDNSYEKILVNNNTIAAGTSEYVQFAPSRSWASLGITEDGIYNITVILSGGDSYAGVAMSFLLKIDMADTVQRVSTLVPADFRIGTPTGVKRVYGSQTGNQVGIEFGAYPGYSPSITLRSLRAVPDASQSYTVESSWLVKRIA